MTETESNPWCFVHFDTVEEMFEAIEKSRATNDEYVLQVANRHFFRPEDFNEFEARTSRFLESYTYLIFSKTLFLVHCYLKIAMSVR